jgi:hypothetical protein
LVRELIYKHAKNTDEKVNSWRSQLVGVGISGFMANFGNGATQQQFTVT